MNKSPIEWTDYTANPLRYRTADGRVVWACVKTSAGCTNCYADSLSTRYGGVRRAGDWNAGTMATLTPFLDEAELHRMRTFKGRVVEACEPCMGSGSDPTGADHLACGHCRAKGSIERGARVFLGDMTDLFGEWVPDALLDRLFSDVLERRTDVTWQLLTKRAQRLHDYLSWRWGEGRIPSRHIHVGVSCENQAAYDERIGKLLRTPARVRFLSLEPLLGPIDLRMGGMSMPDYSAHDPLPLPNWCIVGGESGPKARPMDLAWARSIVKQCQSAGVPCFVKQLGAQPMEASNLGRCEHEQNPCEHCDYGRMMLRNRKGGDPDEWPEDVRARQFPEGR